MARRLYSQGVQVRQQILSAARQAFIEQGVDHASLKEIAHAAGISSGTLFYYYPTKSELIFDVTDQHFDQLTHELLAWVSESGAPSDPRQVLQVVFKTIVGDQLRGKLHHYLIEEAVSSDPSIRARFLQKYREWRDMIEKGISLYVPDAEERRTLSHLILATLDGLVIQAILGVDDLPVEALAGYLANRL